MSKLAALAKTTKLRGSVGVTDVKGVTHLYEDEAAAEAAWGSRAGSLEHRRGAFFEKAAPPAPAAQKRGSSGKRKAKLDGDE